MYFIRKLRPPEISIETIIGIFMLPVILVLFLFFGFRAMFGFIALVELVALIIQLSLYLRSKNPAFLWMAISFAMVLVFAIYLSLFGIDKSRNEYPILAAGVILAALVVIYLIITKKIKWRTREILELSAMPVSEAEDGFTERPMPVGKIDATRIEMESFTHFIRKHLIAIPYYEEDTVIFSLTSNYWKQIGVRKGYDDESWVSIDGEGHVNAYISKQDYMKFKDRFSFDQLSLSLGKLFAGFFEMYKRGEGHKILRSFNDLRLNPFIE